MFVRRTVESPLQNLLATILKDDVGIRNVIEAAVAQVVGMKNLAQEVGEVLVGDPAILPLIGAYVFEKADKTVSHAS